MAYGELVQIERESLLTAAILDCIALVEVFCRFLILNVFKIFRFLILNTVEVSDQPFRIILNRVAFLLALLFSSMNVKMLTSPYGNCSNCDLKVRVSLNLQLESVKAFKILFSTLFFFNANSNFALRM